MLYTTTASYAGITLTTHLVKSEEGGVQFYVPASELHGAFELLQIKPTLWLERLQVKGLNCYKITVKSQDGKMRENTSVAYP